MALDLQSLSITSAFNSIVNFFKSQENNSQWKDLTTGSEGSFLIRLLANVMSAISYKIVAQSRENYISTAALSSSNTGIAVNLGYSVFRGSNLKRTIQIVPNSDYTFPRLSVIGTYDETHDIICLEETTLKAGETADIKVVVGKVKEETFTTGTSATKVFSLFTTGISEDYVLYLESTEVPTTKVMKEMTEDKYLVRTNPYSSVDIMYLNGATGAKYPYGNGSEITIRYVELDNVSVQPFNDNMFPYGTLKNSKNLSTFLPFESVEETKVYAPLDHETQNLIRSKQDYANRLHQIIPAVKTVNYLAATPTYTLLTYLKNDYTILTEAEKEEVYKILKNENYFGTPLPDVIVPRREVANLKIDVKLNTKYKNFADVDLDIKNLIKSNYDLELGPTFNVYDLERAIEDLSYVKYARVGHLIKGRDSDTNYQVGYILNHEDRYYMASKILGLSSPSEHLEWNVSNPENLYKNFIPSSKIDTGLTINDGSLVWKVLKFLPGMTNTMLTTRRKNGQYGIGDFVTDSAFPDYMFECIDIRKSSGFFTPDTSEVELGDSIADGGIIWVTKERGLYDRFWTSSTMYKLGDSVNFPDNENFSFECVSYTGTTGTETDLSFELPIYSVLEQKEKSFIVEGNKTFYFRPYDIISATYSGGAQNFSVKDSVYDGMNTEIEVMADIDTGKEFTTLYTAERGTKDGQILWTLVDDVNNIEYPWNGYVAFDYELNILE